MAAGRVLLAVSGSIAAYKSADLVRRLQKQGLEVRVAMTASAKRFITPLTFEALTHASVLDDLWDASEEIQHVERAYDADLVIIAPATANLIARMAHGLADDIVTSTLLSSRAPLLVAPAMESNMWTHPATRENVKRLESRGARFVGPDAGDLASGRSGFGRLAELETIVQTALEMLGQTRDLEGLRILMTAGPTVEAIDPVRILTNRSTGTMGIAIAEAAARRGATVDLVLGPTHLSVDSSVRTTRVESAAEMLAACDARLEGVDVLIGTAAVSDFRPADPRTAKLKRASADAHRLELRENPDVLATLAQKLRASAGGRSHPPVVVAFAAETEDVEVHAREKLDKKHADFVVANLVGRDRGFGPGETEVMVVGREGGSEAFGPTSKAKVAEFVLDQVMKQKGQRSAG
jgi:phosphopantothenoylcysteine decarboxylase/phosphopantothenate--cysteine ligase